MPSSIKNSQNKAIKGSKTPSLRSRHPDEFEIGEMPEFLHHDENDKKEIVEPIKNAPPQKVVEKRPLGKPTKPKVVLLIIFALVAALAGYIAYDFNTDGYLKYNFVCGGGQSVDKAINATVQITLPDGSGSGFYISPTEIITNNHVVESMLVGDVVEVKLADGSQISGTVKGGDEFSDVALIETSQPSNFTLKPSRRTTKPGEELWAIGYPLSTDLHFQGSASVTKGTFSALREDNSSGRLLRFVQTDVIVNPGNSGGAMVDKCGRVIAVSDKVVAPTQAANITSFGIEVGTVMESIDDIKARNYDNGTKIEGTKRSFFEETEDYVLEVVSNYYTSLKMAMVENYEQEFNSEQFYPTMSAIYGTMFTRERIKGLEFEDWVEQWEPPVLGIEFANLQVDDNDPHLVTLDLTILSVDVANEIQFITTSRKVSWSLDYNLGILLLDEYHVLEEGKPKRLSIDSRIVKIVQIKQVLDWWLEIIENPQNHGLGNATQDKLDDFKTRVEAISGDINELYNKWLSQEPFTEEDYQKYDSVLDKGGQIVALYDEMTASGTTNSSSGAVTNSSSSKTTTTPTPAPSQSKTSTTALPCNVDFCKKCVEGSTYICAECNDGYHPNSVANTCLKTKNITLPTPTPTPVSVTCQVTNCKKCESYSSTVCQECNDGYTRNPVVDCTGGTCVGGECQPNPTPTPTPSPKTTPAPTPKPTFTPMSNPGRKPEGCGDVYEINGWRWCELPDTMNLGNARFSCKGSLLEWGVPALAQLQAYQRAGAPFKGGNSYWSNTNLNYRGEASSGVYVYSLSGGSTGSEYNIGNSYRVLCVSPDLEQTY